MICTTLQDTRTRTHIQIKATHTHTLIPSMPLLNTRKVDGIIVPELKWLCKVDGCICVRFISRHYVDSINSIQGSSDILEMPRECASDGENGKRQCQQQNNERKSSGWSWWKIKSKLYARASMRLHFNSKTTYHRFKIAVNLFFPTSISTSSRNLFHFQWAVSIFISLRICEILRHLINDTGIFPRYFSAFLTPSPLSTSHAAGSNRAKLSETIYIIAENQMIKALCEIEADTEVPPYCTDCCCIHSTHWNSILALAYALQFAAVAN